MPNPLLGWIEPENRTQDQQDAHQVALANMSMFALAAPTLNKGDKVILTKFFEHADVIADLGLTFDGFHQLTGSCVGASDGNAIATIAAVQRLLSDGATKAFIPFWPFSYGRTRYLEGDRGQGEGAVDSVMGTQNLKEGILDVSDASLPKFKQTDGLLLTNKLEMQFSDGGSKLVTDLLANAQKHLTGTRAPIYDTQAMVAAIVNGYAVLTGCNYYVGSGHIKGNGADAYVVGKHDGRGGHSTCFIGVWNHPNDGILFGYWNQWDRATYPADPAGLPRCAVWLPESEVTWRFKNGANNGETMALSHQDYFPAQPKVMDDWTHLF